MPVSRAASSRECPSRISAIASRRRTTAPSRVRPANSRNADAECSSWVISIGLPIPDTPLCQVAATRRENRTQADSGIVFRRVDLSDTWYKAFIGTSATVELRLTGIGHVGAG